MIFPIVELIDRYSIAKLKFAKTGENNVELDFYKEQLASQDLDAVADLCEALYQIHALIWDFESTIS